MVKQSLELHSENVQRRLEIEKRLMDSYRIEKLYEEEIEAASNLTGGFFNEIANNFSLSTDLTIKAIDLAKYIEDRVNVRIKKMEDLADIAEEVNELLKLEDLPNNLDYKIYDYSLHVENVPSRSGYYYFVSFILSIIVISLILILKISYEFRDEKSPS